jgi:hypothetical protein
VHALSIVDSRSGKVAAMFDLVTFCSEMIAAAKRWYEDHQASALVEVNMQNLIRYCPDGLPPFVSGIPVVASGA